MRPLMTRVLPASTASTPILATCSLVSHSAFGSFEMLSRMPFTSWNSE